MNKKTIYLFLILAGVAVAWHNDVPQQAWTAINSSSVSVKLKDSVQNGDFLPGPLRGPFDAKNTHLTLDGVVKATNEQREQNGQLPLNNNEKLDKAAQAKLSDMFAQQYFEHDSPQGATPADVIKKTSYEYVVVGENLALGNFQNDQLLVEAWMNSPGHRANILHPKFQEIGVAVGKGTFEGKTVWLAVQEFGTPLSSCPSPTRDMQKQIDANRVQIQSWQEELTRQKSQLESSRYQTKEDYDVAVKKYNDLAAQTNSLINETRLLVDSYNAEVSSFNKCLDNNA